MSQERAVEMLNSVINVLQLEQDVLHYEQSQSLSLKSKFQYSLYLMQLFASVCHSVALIKGVPVLESGILSQKSSLLLIFFC